MRYMMLIYSRELPDGLPAEEREAVKLGHEAVMDDALRKGVLLGYEGLKPTSTATTVRVQNGTATTMDGPFAETKEQLAGYYIMECANLDEAIEWAKRIPTACKGAPGCIEVRPIADLPRRM